MAIDDNTLYGLTGAQIKELPGKIDAVKGSAKVLTADDYNYPANNPTSVALWLLDPGIYMPQDGNVSVKAAGSVDKTGAGFIYLVGPANSSGGKLIWCFTGRECSMYDVFSNGGYMSAKNISSTDVVNSLTSTSGTTPLSAAQGKALKDFIGDLTNLTTTDKTNLVAAINELDSDLAGKQDALTAGDGITIEDESGSLVISATGGSGGGVIELTSADYNYDEGNTGTNNCIAIWLLESGDYTIGGNTYLKVRSSINKAIFNTPLEYSIYKTADGTRIYTRVESTGKISSGMVAADGSNVTSEKTFLDQSRILQATGTSTSDIMSQNAVTSMVYADPSTKQKVQIGNNSSVTGNYGVAIGRSSSAGNSGAVALGTGNSALGASSVALGDYSIARAKGSIAIGRSAEATTQGTVVFGMADSFGYNNSQYVLMSGLYDPQSAHDAATKGYVDSVAPTITMQTTDPGEGAPLAANQFIGVYE